MQKTNLEFLEQYKQLDKLCRDMYTTKEGVSTYLERMDQTPFSKRQVSADWNRIYADLKHYRWMRNQLAHEISIDSEFCRLEDVDWVKWFHQSILKADDPLARVRKYTSQLTTQKTPPKMKKMPKVSNEQSHPSLWSRLVSRFKKWFS